MTRPINDPTLGADDDDLPLYGQHRRGCECPDCAEDRLQSRCAICGAGILPDDSCPYGWDARHHDDDDDAEVTP